MKLRYTLFSGIFALTLLLITELLLRMGLTFFGYPFLRPADYLFTRFYDNMQELRTKEVRRGGPVKSVLILGGSVVSAPFSHMESRLDTILRKHYGPGADFAFYNIACPGHTSLDNALKYSLLEDHRFDLVIYYEAINENRANNIPPALFSDDYTHMRWYHDIHLLRAHPELNFTVIPYLIHIAASHLRDRLIHQTYISMEQVDPQFEQYGADIKTGASYRKNMEQIIQIARKRGDRLLLMSYASYFPPHVIMTGEQQDMDHFAGCRFASPTLIWGRPENVKKGIDVHNAILRSLVRQYRPMFLDMEARMPKEQNLFCDVCHLSEPGAQRFAHEIVEFIIRHKILE